MSSLINYTFNVWDNSVAILGLIVNSIVAIWLYVLSKRLSARDKYEHEEKITAEIRNLRLFQSVIIADVKKYTPHRKDFSNQTYYKQGAELYTIIPEYGIQVILLPSTEAIPVGLIPFEWVEIIRDHDSEDNEPIIVCKFKGMRWFKDFKSPFKEINYLYVNSNYQEGRDPSFLRYTSIKPSAKIKHDEY